MPRLRHVTLFFLCLLSCATQVQAKCAFIHSDHLGSASWITDFHGEPVQYIHYAPYGELLADHKPAGSTYDERYKFTGKERDAESGYDYFGARFLAQQLGIWLSVDPLADKYIYATPYMYCNDNPIKYVDPNGKWLETAWDIVNVMMDAASLVSNVQNGNTKDAVIDGVGLVLDVAAAIVPFAPGGAGMAIKSARAASRANDAAIVSKANLFRQSIVRGIESEKRVLKDMGLTKNTQKIASKTAKGESINVNPMPYKMV